MKVSRQFSYEETDGTVQYYVVETTPGATIVGGVGGAVNSVAGRTGDVVLAHGDIGDWNEAVQDAVGTWLSAGSAVSIVYNDAANTLTISVSGLASSDISDFAEAVQDQIGAHVKGGTGITASYDDAGTGDTTLAIDTSAENERIDDRVAALLVAGANVTLTYNDGANTLTIAAAGGGGSSTLAADTDVAVASLADKDTLQYDNASSKWKNYDVATTRTRLGLGTAAVKNVPAAGDASTSEVVKGDDTRLTNNRTDASAIHSGDAAGGDLTGTLPSPTVGTNKVGNTKLAQMAANTIKGNNTGSTANAADLTVAQTKTLLAIANTDVSGLGTASTQASSAFVASGADATAAGVVQKVQGVLVDTVAPSADGMLWIWDNSAAKFVAKAVSGDATLAKTGVLTLGTVPIAKGGTGQTGNTAAFDALAPATPAKGTLLVFNGTHWVNIGVGSNTQVLTADSVQAEGIKWAAAGGGGGGAVGTDTIWDTKGDLAVGTGADTAAKLASSGVIGDVPYVLPSETTGLLFGSPRSGSERYLARTSALAETLPRWTCSSAGTSNVSGQLRMQAIYLMKGQTVTNIGILSGSTGATTPTHWWFSLHDSSRVYLRSTADQTTTAWSAAVEKVLALASPFTATYEGLHYIGMMMTAGIPVNTVGATPTISVITAVPILGGQSTTGLTTAQADGTTAGAITSTSGQMYAYVT